MAKESTHWVIDFETMINCTVLVAEHYKTDERKMFVVHTLHNDIPKLIEFLVQNARNKEMHISFNGISFDSQISEYIIRNRTLLAMKTADEFTRLIYDKAQDIISRQNRREWPEWSEKQLSIKQIDVFKLNHWDNPAKSSSLKWIQYSMDWYNIQEMPIHHATPVTTMEQLKIIVGYCVNDVRSTKRIMELSKSQIDLRNTLTKEYKLALMSASEPRISKELFLMFLSDHMNESKWELRSLRTHRDIIIIKDLILPYTKFQTPVFQDLLDNFKMISLDASKTKGGFKYSVIYKGVKTDFGLGGVHGCATPGMYSLEEGKLIMSSDVVSYYPNLAIRNKWSPAHLPKEIFCQLYEWFFEERKKLPKSDPKNYVFKIILNSTYGLSNDVNSFLYDPEFTMRVTINGQLSLMMLYEMLAEGIPDVQPLMQNTDGVEMIIPAGYKDKYMEICAEWEKITNLQLEHDEYQKLVLADVNNYIAINIAGKQKCKGRFEFNDLALHKNKSFLIVPKALYAYFVYDIPPEKFLAENRNIFDYCAGIKAKGDWEFQETCVVEQEVVKRTLQKTIRYYVSEKGCKIIKVNKIDRREIQVEAGRWMQTEFNTAEEKPWDEYGVNDSYYLDKIYNEISNICPRKEQLTLF